LIRRLTKSKKKAAGSTEEVIPNISSTPNHIISKPWKESQIAHSWMVEHEEDPLFEVSRYIPSTSNICSPYF